MRPSVAFLIVAVLCAVTLGQPQVQQKTGVSQKTAQQKEIARLNGRVEELSKSLQNLEAMTVGLQAKLAEVGQRQAATSVPKSSKADQLNLIKSELARFSCESDQNRAFAAALADRLPVHTYEGAGAMECTTRLKYIVERALQALNQE